MNELIKSWQIKLLLLFPLDNKWNTNDNQKNSPAEPATPVDSETISNTDNTNKRVCSTFYSQKVLTDTFTIRHPLWKRERYHVFA